jgi:hypothetical protein
MPIHIIMMFSSSRSKWVTNVRNHFLAILATFAICSAVHAQSGAWADKLFQGKLTHDFGVVNRGDTLKYSFKVTNIYKVPLDITQVRTSCTCIKAAESKKKLEPNESASINVVVDTSTFTGARTVKVYVKVGPQFISEATLFVSMNSRGDIVSTPPQLDFGNIQRGQTPSKTVDLEYVGNSPGWQVKEILNSPTSPYALKVEILPPGPDGKTRRGYRLIATLKADAPIGSFKNDVTLRTNDRVNPDLVYNILGNIQEPLVISPNPARMNGKVGETLTKKIFLRSSEPFAITAIDGMGDGISIELPKGMEATHVLTINLTPTKSGMLRRQLTIRTGPGSELAQLVIEGMIEP